MQLLKESPKPRWCLFYLAVPTAGLALLLTWLVIS